MQILLFQFHISRKKKPSVLETKSIKSKIYQSTKNNY